MPRSFRLPRVYPITDTQISGLTHAEQVAAFAAGGATLVQLRDKHRQALHLYEEAVAASRVAVERGVQLIINDRVDVAVALGAAGVHSPGVHLGQEDLPPHAARRLLGSDAIIGYSTHSLAQAREAASFPIDYLAIGPIFQTSTKGDASPVVGLEGLRVVRKAIGDLPLVAIGGITAENAALVIEAGADSVAMISGLLSNPADISTRVHDVLELLSH